MLNLYHSFWLNHISPRALSEIWGIIHRRRDLDQTWALSERNTCRGASNSSGGWMLVLTKKTEAGAPENVSFFRKTSRIILDGDLLRKKLMYF